MSPLVEPDLCFGSSGISLAADAGQAKHDAELSIRRGAKAKDLESWKVGEAAWPPAPAPPSLTADASPPLAGPSASRPNFSSTSAVRVGVLSL